MINTRPISCFSGNGVLETRRFRESTPDEATRKLTRYTLEIPGAGTSIPDIGFTHLNKELCKGGKNQLAMPWNPRTKRQFERRYKGENIISLQFPTRIGSLTENADIIQEFLESMERKTGHTEYDLVTACKGSLDERKHHYLYHNGKFTFKLKINVAPPTRGFIWIGEAIKKARERKDASRSENNPYRFLRTLGGFYINKDSEALSIIMTDVGNNNPELRELNAKENLLQEIRNGEEILVIAGTGLPLFATRLKFNIPFMPHTSDSIVPVWGARRTNGHLCVIRCESTLPKLEKKPDYPLDPHKVFILDEAVIARTKEALTGQPMPAAFRARIVEETPPRLDQPMESTVPYFRAMLDCFAGRLAGRLIAEGAAFHARFSKNPQKSKTYLNAIRYGPHKPADSERRAS